MATSETQFCDTCAIREALFFLFPERVDGRHFSMRGSGRTFGADEYHKIDCIFLNDVLEDGAVEVIPEVGFPQTRSDGSFLALVRRFHPDRVRTYCRHDSGLKEETLYGFVRYDWKTDAGE